MRCSNPYARFWKVLVLSLSLAGWEIDASAHSIGSCLERLPEIELHGFYEMRLGCRTQDDPHEKEWSVMEARLQGEIFTRTQWAELKFKGDVWADGVTEEAEGDTREAWLFLRPADSLDIKIGRQVLTWGTGELVFVNDLFPKDWQSFFVGRDSEYLKAPSDAAKLSFFTGPASLDVVYTPEFDPDRFVTGETLSYWNGAMERRAGQDAIIDPNERERWFEDDELAVRLYGTFHNYELALYGYWGFWKRPAGRTPSGEAVFPELHVYGASARGQLGPGIANIELAYYRSTDDVDGTDPLTDNSEMRYLVGYSKEIARELNAGFQYYVEHMLDYSAYRRSLDTGPARDRFRHVLTVQLTQLLMSQDLELSLSAYYSPTDQDGYLRPKIHYKYADPIAVEVGANVFFGKAPHTFFAQLENNTNIYVAFRYSF